MYDDDAPHHHDDEHDDVVAGADDRVDGPNYVDDDDFFNIPSQRAPGSCLV